MAIQRFFDSQKRHPEPFCSRFNALDQEWMNGAFTDLCNILDEVKLEETFLQPDAGTQTESVVTCSSGAQTRTTNTTSTSMQTSPISTATTGVQTADTHPRTYAEALIQTDRINRKLPHPAKHKPKPKPKGQQLNPSKPQPQRSTNTTRAYVVHGIRATDKLWKVREDIERGNLRNVGRLQGIRWLLNTERREGKGASSVVIYLDSPKARPPYAWLGHRKLRVDNYEFDRGRDVEMTGG
jgi:hypothetical protein